MIHVHAYVVLGQMHVRVTCAEPVEEPQGLRLVYSISSTSLEPAAQSGTADELFQLSQALYQAAADLHDTEFTPGDHR